MDDANRGDARRGATRWRASRGPWSPRFKACSSENWLECCGEILTGPGLPELPQLSGDTTAIVVKSSPSDRATVSRVAFQVLIEGADATTCAIATPYFLPDRAFRGALAEPEARRSDQL